jgi:16S rRNA (adenine1518-N6/adenine1519-N6)-dimethyltransferase
MYHKAKKSMGQNFLKSKQAIRDIVVAGEIAPGDVVLEIGPGKGVLTEALLNVGAKVIAVEKDDDLVALLSEKFEKEIKNGSLVLENEDILTFNKEQLTKNKYKIIANIPYNITGAILEKFLTAEIQPERMVLMVQKEVAQRIVARDGKESILSLSVKAFGEPKYIAKVPAKYFSPAPKVDSAILGIFNINRNNFKTIDEEKKFFEIVKTGFAHKRKLLRGNLSKILTKEGLGTLAEKSRAEDIPIKDWLMLAKYFDNR